MIKTIYDLDNTDDIVSPALVYYEDIIRANTQMAIDTAGGAQRLWPHVKTHKTPELIRMQVSMGITRFKCATIAETEMAAQAGAPDVLMSYPLVGPSIPRFLRLVGLYPNTRFWALGDDENQLRELGKQAAALGIKQRVVIDVDSGMHRTGVPLADLDRFYRAVSQMPGLEVLGMHCYDGHNHQKDLSVRTAAVNEGTEPVYKIQEALQKSGLDCGVMIMGGTPSFPCFAQTPGVFLSPGTVFVFDYGYSVEFPDLKYTPGAAILTRVISTPGDNYFTIDLGYKGVAADQSAGRGVIANLPETEPVGHSEEHWVFQMKKGAGDKRPKVGDVLYVIPYHICPTTSLYSSVLVAKNGKIVDSWEVVARNRKISV